MWVPLGEDERWLSDAELVALGDQHERDKATPGFSGPTELERALVRGCPRAESTEELLAWLVESWLRRIGWMKAAQQRAQAEAERRQMQTRSVGPKATSTSCDPATPASAQSVAALEHEPLPLLRPGAHGRYQVRCVQWRSEAGALWRLRHAGWWWWRLGRWDEAERVLLRMLWLDPSDPQVQRCETWLDDER